MDHSFSLLNKRRDNRPAMARPSGPTVEILTGAGNWIAPFTGDVLIEGWGGGGGGGGSSAGQGGGGGQGGHFNTMTFGVTQGNSYEYVAGEGGLSGDSDERGGDGTASDWFSGTLLCGAGVGGVEGSSGGFGGSSEPSEFSFAGGGGGEGLSLGTGGGGGGGASNKEDGIAGNDYNGGPGGGPLNDSGTAGGDGGDGGSIAAGSAGNAPAGGGGGGGAGAGGRAGGAGADGMFKLTYPV